MSSVHKGAILSLLSEDRSVGRLVILWVKYPSNSYGLPVSRVVRLKKCRTVGRSINALSVDSKLLVHYCRLFDATERGMARVER